MAITHPKITSRTTAETTYSSKVIANEVTKESLAKGRVLQGKRAWKLIHCYRGNDPFWFSLWTKFIPQYCDCEANFKQLIMKFPPDFSSPEAFFDWSIFIHNKVNVELNKPEISYEEAYNYWKPRRESLYALYHPMIYGGIERWSISLARHLPAFGFTNATQNVEPDNELASHLLSLAPECSIDEAALCCKPIIVSNVFELRKPVAARTILLAHGYCDYTRNWVTKIYNECDTLVAVSKRVAEAVSKWTGKDCDVIENGIDTDRLTQTIPRDEARKLFDIPQDAYVMGYCGRFTDEKGISKAIDTVAATKDAYGLFIGWGETSPYRAKVDAMGITDRIRFVPAIPQVGNALGAMDTFLSLSLQEGFGLAVLEAMYFGLPVITTRTGIAEQLENTYGDYGPLIVDTDLPGISIAIANKMTPPKPIDRSLISHLTSEAMASRWETYLRDFKTKYYG